MGESEAGSLSSDDAFDLLSNQRRRLVLHHVRTQDGPVEVGTLAREIAATENDVPIDEVTSQQRKRVYVSLYQTHLPKMADLNVVEYDQDAGVVRMAAQTADTDRYLASQDTSSPSYRLPVVIVAGLAVLALGGAVTTPFGLPAALWLALGVVAALVAVQVWFSREGEGNVPDELSR